MRFESRQSFARAKALLGSGRQANFAHDLPPEIAFLQKYHVDDARLLAGAFSSRQNRTCAAEALIAEGGVSSALYYRALARHLGLSFTDKWPLLEPLKDPAAAYAAGSIRLTDANSTKWLVAPRQIGLRALLTARRQNVELPDVAITTPSHLAAVLQHRAQDAIEDAARDVLPRYAPRFSAKRSSGFKAGAAIAIALIGCFVAAIMVPRLTGDVLGLLFFAGICFRLLVCSAGAGRKPRQIELSHDEDLPFYTVLVPLRQEAAMVPNLIANLQDLDYPPAKLEILILVEPEDKQTCAVLSSMSLPPWFHVVVGPIDPKLRTKPRALNIGLVMARGSLLTVYDAEDRPEPDQLRRAATLFNDSPKTLACLQARLAMGNSADGLLPKIFAVEYAALFDLYNVGTTALGLPLALGGTSNHFRVSALRAVGGWDAWNVTEDADLGLRLARFGYEVGTLDSTTMEIAPTDVRVWMKQRRRWTKGWMQTLLVIARDCLRFCRQLGLKQSVAVMLMLMNLVAGPLLLPFFLGLVTYNAWVYGIPKPHNLVELFEATLSFSVLLLGASSTLWPAYQGLRARRLQHCWIGLLLILPYQLMISAAAFMGLFDLMKCPYHWHKTPH